MNRNTRGCLFALLLLLGASGCVRENVEGETHTFAYELWVSLSLLLGGLAATAGGWLWKSKTESQSNYVWVLLIGGPIAALGFAPSLFLERSVVDNEKLTINSGIWGQTATHELKLDNLRQIRIISEESRGRRGRKRTSYYMMCDRKAGETAKVSINNDVTEAAAGEFIEQAIEHGVPVLDET